ncbi:MAG: hypothetical protein RMJ52_18785 [Gemmataceae bacterium]|nr:hypothetical protein [Gemmataceae bacterium]
MSSLTMAPHRAGFGATSRRDLWWVGPLATFLGLMAFLIYAHAIVLFVPGYYEIRENPDDFFAHGNRPVAPYLAPFSSPLIYGGHSPHAWIAKDRPDWWPRWFPFTSAMLILIFPAGFRFTCYYYRKAYYRAFWADPPACAVGEPRQSYWGENHWPLLIQNIHRYFMYAAVLFLAWLAWDALYAFWWPTDRHGRLLPDGGHQIGMGVGTILMVVNVLCLAGFTFGCNSVRHLVGGRYDCFACPHNIQQERTGYKLWRWVTRFNEHHMEWAWVSLFTVGFTDFYIRMCAAGIWTDYRIF